MNHISTPTFSTMVTRIASTQTRRRIVGAAAAVVVGMTLVACGSDDAASTDSAPAVEAEAGSLTIADPWSRQPAEGQTATAVYGIVTNNTDQDVTAVAVSTSVTDTVELHEVTMSDEGQMSMNEKEGGFMIPAGESFSFEPGGAHIMMLDIDAATYPDMVDVVLEFDTGATIDFTAEVRAIGDTDTGDMGDMGDMGGMDDMEGEMEGETDGEMDG